MAKIFLVIGILLQIASATENNIEFDFAAFLNGKYSISYQREICNRFSFDGKLQYSNRKYGYISRIGAPLEKVEDVSLSAGTSFYPFQKNKGLFGSIAIEAGYASISLDKDLTPTSDSITADGLFVAPTLNFGYKFVAINRVSITPLIGLFYNFSFIDYSNIGRWEGLSYWAIAEDFPFSLTWDNLHNIRKGFALQLGLKVGLLF